MFEKLEKKHLPLMLAYIEEFNDDVIYLLKPLEQFSLGNPMGVFYGYIENAQLMGIFYFSMKSVMTLHTKDLKILGNLQLLKAIKHHKPKFIKGTQSMVDGIYKLICRAVVETTEHKSTLMSYTLDTINVTPVEAFHLITGDHELVEQLLNDLRFFIDVETHFGRQVKAINDIVKEFKVLINQENYMLAVKGNEIVAQGLIEDETDQMALLSGIYVAPKYRKIGLGEMITGALTEALLLRNRKPYLFVKNNNTSARRLYEKMGYKAIKQYSILTVVYQ